MITVSEAVRAAAARSDAEPSTAAENRGAGTRARARARKAVTQRARQWISLVVADARTWWWVPQSLPTLAAAWEHRMPPRNRVPAGNHPLWLAWVVWSHTVGLLVPAMAVVVIGGVSVAAWVLWHPARAMLAAAVTAALILLI